MRKILVPLFGRASDRRAVATAFQVSERFGAHVQGLSVTAPLEARRGFEGSALPHGLIDSLRKIQDEEHARVVEEARALFETVRTRHKAVFVGQGAKQPEA